MIKKNLKKFMCPSYVLLLFLLLAVAPVVSASMVKIRLEHLTREADVIVTGDIKEVRRK